MHAISAEADPSAVGFHELTQLVVAETNIPDPDLQVYQQQPNNGLYYRSSGNLLSSQPEGNFYDRAMLGQKESQFFELKRKGAVQRLEPSVILHDRIHPVYGLVDPTDVRYVGISWLDEEGVHHVMPRERGDKVTVLSWLGSSVAGQAFACDTTSSFDRKVQSDATEDPALEFCDRALKAYRQMTIGQAS